MNPAVCNGCHYRLKRTGTLARREWAYRSRCAQGYIRVFKTTHPLAIGGYVYEHRQVLYDAIGPGPHPCHWCRTDINWVVGRISRGALVPDHVDGDKANNNIDNLVPSCHRCNASRGLFMSWVSKHKDDPFLWMLYQKALGAQAAS